MDIKAIQDILKFINKSSLTDVEIEQKDFRLRVQRRLPENNVIYSTVAAQPQVVAPVAAAAAPAAAEAKPAEESAKKAPAKAADADAGNENLIEFKAPFIGTFYRAPGPDKDPYVKVGDVVSVGQALGVIEAMKLFNEIESDVEGKVVKILVDNATPVEYEQPLFLIEPI
ncbi:MAG: acetyl-CoA carboxylase biotin carboxyl carrier protein [Bacteroidota bacterium]